MDKILAKKNTPRFLILIAIATISLCSCTGNSNKSDVTSVSNNVSSQQNSSSKVISSSSVAASSLLPVLTVDVNKEPLGFEKNIAPDFLNEDQQTVYKKAIELQSALLIESGNINLPYLDTQTKQEISTSEIMIDEKQHYLVQGRYSKWDDLYAVMTTIFTEEYFTERFGKRFVSDESGNALVLSASRGTNNERTEKPDSYELVRQTETEIEFNVIGYYKSKDDGKEYTKSFTNKMVLGENGWRISQFEITI